MLKLAGLQVFNLSNAVAIMHCPRAVPFHSQQLWKSSCGSVLLTALLHAVQEQLGLFGRAAVLLEVRRTLSLKD